MLLNMTNWRRIVPVDLGFEFNSVRLSCILTTSRYFIFVHCFIRKHEISSHVFSTVILIVDWGSPDVWTRFLISCSTCLMKLYDVDDTRSRYLRVQPMIGNATTKSS